MPRLPQLLPVAGTNLASLLMCGGGSLSALRVLHQARDAIASADAAAAASPCVADDAFQEARDGALADAEVLMSHVLSIPRHSLRLNLPKLHLQPSHVLTFSRSVARRCTGTPTPYITRSRHFFEHEFFVTEDVLIPRPETEVLVAEALQLAPRLPPSSQSIEPAFTFVDLGCGSGMHPLLNPLLNSFTS